MDFNKLKKANYLWFAVNDAAAIPFQTYEDALLFCEKKHVNMKVMDFEQAKRFVTKQEEKHKDERTKEISRLVMRAKNRTDGYSISDIEERENRYVTALMLQELHEINKRLQENSTPHVDYDVAENSQRLDQEDFDD